MNVRIIATSAMGGLVIAATWFMSTMDITQFRYADEISKQQIPTKKPHIVLVVADDLGWNDIGYHNTKLKTPTLDYLANNGVKLENYYVQPICSPSRVQLLSGKYQIHLGLQHSLIFMGLQMGLPLDVPTLGDQLQAQGYSTHALGKWHAGFYSWAHMPTRRGFHSFLGHLGSLDDYYIKKKCAIFPGGQTSCGFSVYDDETIVRDNEEYSPHFYTRRAQQIIQHHPKDKPLFLYLAYQNVHRPLQVPEYYQDMYSSIKDNSRRTYAGMVSSMDEAIRDVTGSLKAEGLWDDTVFIFTTDNGGDPFYGGNNWPLAGGKGSYWEGGIRGLSFVHSPKYLPHSGRASHGLMHISDWYPTLLHLAGGQKLHTNLDGFNQWVMISMGRESQRSEILHNIDPLEPRHGRRLNKTTFDTRQQAALRVNEWKLLTGVSGNERRIPPPEFPDVKPDHDEKLEAWEPGKNVLLFNITADPYERNDLSSTYPQIVLRMLDKLSSYERTASPCSWPSMDPASNPDLHGGAWVPWINLHDVRTIT